MDNEVSIPYHGGLSVGVAVDFTERQLARGATSVVDGIAPTSSKIKSMSCKFCLADKFIHVCQVLDIPHEYALKVESGQVHNDVIKTCLHDIYNKRTFKVIFRLKYIWERQEHTTSLGLDPEWDPLSNSDTLDTGREGVLTSGEERPATHVVKALYTGDELVVVMTISATESDDLDSFYEIIEADLGGLGGYIEADTMLKTVEKLGASLDNNLDQKRYKDVKCGIKYGTYADLDTYPTTVSGMARVVKEFTNKWMYAENAVLHPAISAMNVRTENDKGGQTEESTPVMQMSSKTIDVFKLRVTLQPAVDNGRPMTEDYLHAFEAIFSCVYALNKTSWNIQDFLKNHKLFSNATYKSEGEEIDKLVRQKTDKMIEIIKGLVMGQPLSMGHQQKLKEMAAKTRDEVDNFITKVTTKLPVGGDLNLLIIGKTGHGKSSTANTILRRKEFVTSSLGISETKTCQRSWSKLDDRTFKVVDVPGVCDTNLDSAESVKLAVKCISQAISTCSNGFHALLLVLRYGNRMTEEEERAIYMLKCILGQAIVHSHCICVVTHGDNFEESEGSFEKWCKRQVGYLKDVFEECNYRCVLFDNKTSDPTVLKTQLIELVSKVDSLKDTDGVYTNELFKYSERDRQRLSDELNLPHFKDEFLKDLNLLQDDFEEIEKADASERTAKIEKLKNSTEKLRRKLENNRCGELADIYQAVSNFSERLHRQEEKEFADLQLREERERFQQREKQLKQEWEAYDKMIKKETARRILEAVTNREKEVKTMFMNRSWLSKFYDLFRRVDI